MPVWLDDGLILRCLAMVLSTIIIMGGSKVAIAALYRGSEGDRPWWSVLLGCAVAVAMVLVGFRLFLGGSFFWE